MEHSKQYESDRKLLAYWLARKADAQTALDTANRQIEYLTKLLKYLGRELPYENPTINQHYLIVVAQNS